MLKLKMRHAQNTTIRGMGDPQQRVELHAVVGATGDNAEWSKYTPSGKLEFTVTNEAAFDRLTPGVEYIVTIEKAPSDA